MAVRSASVGSGYLAVGRTCTVRPSGRIQEDRKDMTNKKVLIVTVSFLAWRLIPNAFAQSPRQCPRLLRRIIPESTFAIVL